MQLDDPAAPGEAVENFGEAIAVRLQFVFGDSGIIQMSDGEIADKSAISLFLVLQVSLDRSDQVFIRDKFPCRHNSAIGGTSLNPLF